MRSLARNQQKIYYARIVDGDPIKDEDGNETGENHKCYDSVKELWINVSPAKGSEYSNPFGKTLQYDKTLSISDTSLFNENDINVVFWIGKDHPVQIQQDVFTHNYELAGVAGSLNGLLIAVKRRNVS